MRTLTTAQSAVLTARHGWCGWARVRVQDGGGTYRDLTSIFNKDFLVGVSIDEQTDMPVGQATVTVRREIDFWRLAPLITDSPLNTLVGGSYDPLLKEGRTFVVETALMPDGSIPASTDWMESFRGRIDAVDAGPDELTFTGRDSAGKLTDTFIEVERAHSSQSLESHLTKILTDNSMVAEFPLYTPTSPSVTFGAYVQETKPVYEALQHLARQIGWEVRWKWDNGTSAYRLTLWKPDRAASSPVATFSDREYSALDTVRSTLEDIRNVVEVVYSDTADLDTTGKPKRKTYVASDAASITAYGRRWMRIAEAASSNINTSSEAQKMAEAARDDLKTVNLEISATLDFRPDLELGDLVRFSGNAWHFTADQDVAIAQVTHEFRGNSARTKIRAIGKPRTSTRQWLSMDVRPGLAPPPPLTGPGAPTNVAVAAVVNGVRVTWAPPATGPSSPAAASYEVHISTSSGFTPGSGTYRGATDSFEFVDPSLSPGVTYYAKVVPRDAKGNVGTTSSQASTTSAYVRTHLLQPVVSFDGLPRNRDYEDWPDSGVPPPGWTLAVGTWGTDGSQSSSSVSGAFAVRIKKDAVIRSQAFLVTESRTVFGQAVCQKDPLAATIATLRIHWLDVNFATVSTVTLDTRTLGSGIEILFGYAVAPSTTRYAYLEIVNSSTAASVFGMAVDTTLARELEPDIFANYTRGTSQSIANATVTIVDFSTLVEDAFGAVTTGSSWKFTAKASGLYQAEATVVLESVPDATRVFSGFYKNGSEARRGPDYESGSGFASLHATGTVRLAATDTLDYRVYQESGGSLNTSGGAAVAWITVIRIGD